MTWNELIQRVFAGETLIHAIFSDPQAGEQRLKVTIKPFQAKEKTLYQVSSRFANKETHANLNSEDCRNLLEHELLTQFKQAAIFTSEHDYMILVSKKGTLTIKSKPASKQPVLTQHNRPKNHLLLEGEPVPFLIALGVMSQEGKVIAKMRDKFIQVNRFLEMIRDMLPHLKKESKLRIIDFGCGKAYLTFAIYHYLHHVLGYELEMIGLDLKEDVIAHCQKLADDLGQDKQMRFYVQNIQHYNPSGPIDMVITLHACNTATDAALLKAIEWNADVILSVPCCHHELLGQIQNEMLKPILKHGILKERLSALATDAARAELLTIAGYNTQVVEFIDLEHTAKNLMIRAFRKAGQTDQGQAVQQYRNFASALNISPYMERNFSKKLQGLSADQDQDTSS